MIPYFQFISFQVGPLTLYVWGFFVAAGIVLGLLVSARNARRFGLDPEAVAEAGFWTAVFGFLGGRLGHIVFYNAADYLRDPLEIFRVWRGGFSSLGGFLAGAIFFAVYRARKRISMLGLADALSFGFLFAWALGRVGCFLIHDHPGRPWNGFLSVNYPDTPRWDLGLIEMLTALVLIPGAILAARHLKKPGLLTAAVWLPYLTIRFFTDFLRAVDLPGSDARFFGLTPMQIAAPVFIAIIVFIAGRGRNVNA